MCHDGKKKWHTKPREWKTTPAESGTDPWPKPKKCNKTVRWAENLIHVFAGIKPWDQVLEPVPSTSDPATIEDDFPEGFVVTIRST